ncbi:Protein of unknown function [Leuconostoc citreum LBAE C11]|nr:Protein of unknown function [Leuconostoc citreum LBAE C11]
MVYYLF